MIFESASIWLLVKVFYLVAFSVYVVFAAVTVKQTYLMTQTLEIGLESLVRTLSWAHFIFALAVLVLAFILL